MALTYGCVGREMHRQYTTCIVENFVIVCQGIQRYTKARSILFCAHTAKAHGPGRIWTTSTKEALYTANSTAEAHYAVC